jgi:hypothetical protein
MTSQNLPVRNVHFNFDCRETTSINKPFLAYFAFSDEKYRLKAIHLLKKHLYAVKISKQRIRLIWLPVYKS